MPNHEQPAVAVHCQIVISGNEAHIRGEYPLEVVRAATSYMAPGYKFSKAFKQKRWDGRKHLCSTKGVFPAGLTQTVVKALRKAAKGALVGVTDEREDSPPAGAQNGFELQGVSFGGGKFGYQLEAVNAAVRQKRGILKMATNSGKSECAVAITKHLALPTGFLVMGIGLLHQARERFARRLGVPLDDIGIVGDGQMSFGKLVTIASVDTLATRLDVPEVQEQLKRWQVIFCDECHHAASETCFDVLDAIPAYYRFGLSGTPLDRSGGDDLRLIGQTGEIIYEVTNKQLVELGISVQPYVEMLRIDEPRLPKYGMTWGDVNKIGVVENAQLNRRISERAAEAADNGERVLICVEKINHGKTITELLDGRVAVKFLSGAETPEARKAALDALVSGELSVVVATSILDEGIDVPAIDVIILAGGGKARIGTLQRIGRGLRSGEGKNRLTVVDFANFCHKILTQHSLERLETYKAEDCFKITTE